MTKEQLLEAWKARAQVYRRRIDRVNDQVLEVFRRYDKRATGTMAMGDMREALTSLGIQLSDKEMTSCLHASSLPCPALPCSALLILFAGRLHAPDAAAGARGHQALCPAHRP
mmetsp:Transcript_10628/g.35575  ORF Transcript_10628/g.35575 Transcript_10628/m.35575 type:complete len:113 (-) Transcript_10628:2591-2929(-)